MADQVDCKTWLTTRTYEGIFRVRARDTFIDPFALARNITLPPLAEGFRRESIRWAESPNGLEMSFVVIDQERYAQAPGPATHWEGTYSISFPAGDITAETELSFRLWADRNLDKRILTTLAQSILDKKLHWQKVIQIAQDNSVQGIVLTQRWEENLAENEIAVTARIRHVNPDNINGQFTADNFKGPIFEFGNDLPHGVSQFAGFNRSYNKTDAYVPPKVPTAGLPPILVAALQNPCCPLEMPKKKQRDAFPEELTIVDQGELTEEERERAIAELTREDRQSLAHAYNCYTWCKQQSSYITKTGYRGLPLAKSSSPSKAIVKMHADSMMREVRIDACRIDAWPALPDLRHSFKEYNSGFDYILISSQIDPCTPRVTADGIHELRQVYARFIYDLTGCPDPFAHPFEVGMLPYLKQDMNNQGGLRMGTDTFVDPDTIISKMDVPQADPDAGRGT
jgi:hypothetical protein